MPRKLRLRRVVILCREFARNLAYVRAGQREEYSQLFAASNPTASFWRVIRNNALDMCVLEWCKLFGDKQARHYWGNIVSNPADFEEQLLINLQMGQEALGVEIAAIRRYRDKFVAHLDSENRVDIPKLDVPKSAVWFYHKRVIEHEAQPGDLYGLPRQLDAVYHQCEEEACSVFRIQPPS
jgi:hypothetical protein